MEAEQEEVFHPKADASVGLRNVDLGPWTCQKIEGLAGFFKTKSEVHISFCGKRGLIIAFSKMWVLSYQLMQKAIDMKASGIVL